MAGKEQLQELQFFPVVGDDSLRSYAILDNALGGLMGFTFGVERAWLRITGGAPLFSYAVSHEFSKEFLYPISGVSGFTSLTRNTLDFPEIDVPIHVDSGMCQGLATTLLKRLRKIRHAGRVNPHRIRRSLYERFSTHKTLRMLSISRS